MSLFTQPQTILEGELWDKTKQLVKKKGKETVEKVGQHIKANKGKYMAIAGGVGAYALRDRIKQPFQAVSDKAGKKSEQKWKAFQKNYKGPMTREAAGKDSNYKSSDRYDALSKVTGAIGRAGRTTTKYGGPAAVIGGIAALADKYIPLRKKKKEFQEYWERRRTS